MATQLPSGLPHRDRSIAFVLDLTGQCPQEDLKFAAALIVDVKSLHCPLPQKDASFAFLPMVRCENRPEKWKPGSTHPDINERVESAGVHVP